jgi:UDPglucose--hexose-1-phosphate uridylyltransferase
MGLAILPARLKTELLEVEKYLLNQENEMSEIHRPWAEELKKTEYFSKETVHETVQGAVGEVFEQVLKDAGVFKDNQEGQAGFHRFINFINA